MASILIVSCKDTSTVATMTNIKKEVADGDVSNELDSLSQCLDNGFFCDTVMIPSGTAISDAWESAARIMYDDEKTIHPRLDPKSLQSSDSTIYKTIIFNNYHRKINSVFSSLKVIKPRANDTVVIKEMWEDGNDGGPIEVDVFGKGRYIYNELNKTSRQTISKYRTIDDLSYEDDVYYNWRKEELKDLIVRNGHICGGTRTYGYNIKMEGNKAIIRFYVESKVLDSLKE